MIGSCPDCKGRGWLLASGSARRCHCRAEQRSPDLTLRAGIPARYANCRVDSFLTTVADSAGGRDQLVAAKAESRRYVEEFLEEDGSFRETGLLFIGPPGVGKTHLAVAVLLDLVRSYGVRGRFVDFTSLLHEIQSTFDPSEPATKSSVLDPVTRAEVLVLDELAAQKFSPWVADILYLIMNTRYARRLPTLFTTNYSLDKPLQSVDPNLDRGADAGSETPYPKTLQHRISDPLISRLHEMARPVLLEAVPDFRRHIAAAQHRI